MFLLVQAYPGSPGQKAVKWLCVCVRACVRACMRACVRVCNASVNLADRHSEHLIYQLCFRVCTDSKNYCLLPFVLYVDGKVLALSLP